MSTGDYVLVAILLLSTTFGIYRKLSDGKLKPQAQPAMTGLAEHLYLDTVAAPKVTMLQFSSEFCHPCRITRGILEKIATDTPVACHIELDIVEHLDLVNTYGITRTPTTLIIDNQGTVKFKAVGVPKRTDIEQAISQLA